MCVRSVFVSVSICVSLCFSWPAIVLTARKALLCFVMCGSYRFTSMGPINTDCINECCFIFLWCLWYCTNINKYVRSHAAAPTKPSGETQPIILSGILDRHTLNHKGTSGVPVLVSVWLCYYVVVSRSWLFFCLLPVLHTCFLLWFVVLVWSNSPKNDL